MVPTTPTQRAALLGSHQMELKVSVLRGSVLVGDIQVESGTVSATYGTQGGRDAVIEVDRNVLRNGTLNPLSDQVYIRTGIPGVIEVPIFTGRVDTHNANSEGFVTVQLLSRGAEAIRAAFEQPWAAIDGNTARNEISRILLSIDSSWSVDTLRANANVIARNLVWEDDPGQALDQLARGASLIWQPNRTGGFEVFTNPYLIGPSLGSTVQIIFRDGAGGTTVTVDDAESREGIYNSVTVVSEKYGNQAPVRVTVRDVGASSPTRWGGLFGKQNLVFKSQTPIDVAQCQALAVRVLNQSLALQRTWTITTPHMPLLDPGDVFGLWYENEVTTQVVEAVEYSTNAQDPTVITSRELRQVSAEILTA
jgi:hypothetical protein